MLAGSESRLTVCFQQIGHISICYRKICISQDHSFVPLFHYCDEQKLPVEENCNGVFLKVFKTLTRVWLGRAGPPVKLPVWYS